MTFKVGQIVRVKPLGDHFDFTIEARIEAIVRSDEGRDLRLIPSGSWGKVDLWGADGNHMLDLFPGWYFSVLERGSYLGGELDWVRNPIGLQFDVIEISIEVIE